MIIDIFSYIILAVGSIVYLFVRGRRYGFRPEFSLLGAFWRSVTWSFIICWTVLALSTGHGPGVLVLPSWFAVFLAAFEGYTGAIPSLWISPALPIFGYWVGAFTTRKL